MVEVTQEDYDAAQVYADMYSESECYSPSYHQRIAEAFARHRIAAEQRGKIEGARLAIEAAGDWLNSAPPHLSMQEYAQSIRALSPPRSWGKGDA